MQSPGRIFVLTLLAVTGVFLLVGLAVVPFLIRRMEAQYFLLQADINARQARALTRLAGGRIAAGQAPERVIEELQTLIAGADYDRGFSCVVDRGTTAYLCHPMQVALGMSVAVKHAGFATIDRPMEAPDREPFNETVARGYFGPGTLTYPDGSGEIVHLENVPGTRWTITTHENSRRVREELARFRTMFILGAGAIGLLLAVPSSFAARAVSARQERRIEAEREQSERLLLNILPATIAERLKSGEQTIADSHPQVTVLFADVVGFTPWAARVSAPALVEWLNQIVCSFDDLCAAHRLEKIKTIGDAYMLCGGLDGDPADAAARVVTVGLEMIRCLQALPPESNPDGLSLRVGVHTGPLVAGVIGKRKFSFDVWGDAVNIASRVESGGVPGRVQLTQQTADLLGSRFALESRGEVALKGKGNIPLWLITGPAQGEAR